MPYYLRPKVIGAEYLLQQEADNVRSISIAVKKEGSGWVNYASYLFQPRMQKAGKFGVGRPKVFKRKLSLAIFCQQAMSLLRKKGRVKVDKVDTVGIKIANDV